MAGAPSHLELFDNKPQLTKFDGTLPPPELLKGYRAAFINPNSKLIGPKFKFNRYGESQTELAELLPHLGEIVDDVADREVHGHGRLQPRARSVVDEYRHHAVSDAPAWAPGRSTGLGPKPATFPASWCSVPARKGRAAAIVAGEADFFPPFYQGVQFRSGGDPVLYLSNPPGCRYRIPTRFARRHKAAEHMRLDATGDPEIATRINSFEMAFRMQAVAPELMDIAKESPEDARDVRRRAWQSVLRQQLSAGAPAGGEGRSFRSALSRSLGPAPNLIHDIAENCRDTDRASAALVMDLKHRGLLDDTLVVWGGEFGRTPMVQGGSDGRTIIPTRLLCGWPAAASSRRRLAKPTNWLQCREG